MFLAYERSLQPGLVGAGLIVAVAGLVEACWITLQQRFLFDSAH
jgi:hypothetical protein